MSRMQPHSFVGGSNYQNLGNVAGPKHSMTHSAPLSGIGTFIAGVGTLSAVSFLYGVVKKKPNDLMLGYVGAAAISTMPVAIDMWLKEGQRYGNLSDTGMLGTYISLAAPPVIAMFAGSQIGNYIMSGAPKPRSNKKSWYQGVSSARRKGSGYVRTDKTGYVSTDGASKKKADQKARKQRKVDARRPKNKNKGRGKKRKSQGSSQRTLEEEFVLSNDALNLEY